MEQCRKCSMTMQVSHRQTGDKEENIAANKRENNEEETRRGKE
jgi:hypothetical protein